VNDLLFPQDKQLLKQLPVRFIRKNKPMIQEPVFAFDNEGEWFRRSEEDRSWFWRLNSCCAGKENTLYDVLQQVLPEFYASEQVKQLPQAIVQGLLPPFNTPILWLW